MIYIGEEERIFPQYGVFKPGEEADYDETLHSTGLFDDKKAKKEKSEKKDGDE